MCFIAVTFWPFDLQNDPDDPTGKSLEFNKFGGAGAPIITESGNIKTRMPITMKRDEKGGKRRHDDLLQCQSNEKQPEATDIQRVWNVKI